MRALALASLLAVSLAACRVDDSLPTGIRSGDADHAIIIKIDPNRFTAITAGDDFTCATRASGEVFCWGRNEFLQTGRGTSSFTCWWTSTPCVFQPTLVRDSTGAPLIGSRVDAGAQHVCMTNRANTAICWGAGGVGQLGQNGLWPTTGIPRAVSNIGSVSLIAAGRHSSCAQSAAGVSCWGMINWATAPVVFTAYSSFADLTVGEKHACGIEFFNFRQVDCWGSNDFGQGANQQPAQWMQIFPVPALFGTQVNRVVSQVWTTCVDQANGTVQCAGSNYRDVLGAGPNVAFTPIPQTIGNGMALRAVSIGFTHACALNPSGAAFCWGNNAEGELGTGNFNNSSAPVAVNTPLRFTAIAAGGRHTCAIGTDNGLYCWGTNFEGQLGTNQTGRSTVPQATMALAF